MSKRKPWWKSRKIWVLLAGLLARMFGQRLGWDESVISTVETTAYALVGVEASMDGVEALSDAIADREKR